MPISKYFGGHGTKVMADMRKKHGKRAEEVFYATANKKGREAKPKSKMPAGAKMSPHGDLGAYRQEESVKAGGFTDGETVRASSRL